jgi:hypothetical protein
MKRFAFLLLVLAPLWGGANAILASTNLVSTNRILIIEPSSMAVAGGRATLSISPLCRSNGVYSGEYQIDVTPYFFKNEKGKLAINVPDDCLAEIAQGNTAAITGTATTSRKGGVSRPIGATATPANVDHGKIKLWFKAGEREMIFEPAYHFAEKDPATNAVETKTASGLPRRLPNTYREALEGGKRRP